MTDTDVAQRSGRGNRAVLEIVCAAALFGTTGTAAALGPDSASAVSVGAVRLIVGGLGLVAILSILGVSRAATFALLRRPIVLLAGLATAVYQVAFFAGVARAGVGLGAVVAIGSGPVLVGLLSWIALRERPTRLWVIATSVCLVGLGCIVLGAGSNTAGTGGEVLIGLGLVLIASFGYAAYTVIARGLIVSGADSTSVMAAAFGLGAVVLVPVAAATSLAWIGSWSGIAMALWLGLVATTLAYVLFGRALRVLPAPTVATLVLAEPVVATLLGVVVLGERPTGLQWLGMGLVAVSLVVVGARTGSGGRTARGSG